MAQHARIPIARYEEKLAKVKKLRTTLLSIAKSTKGHCLVYDGAEVKGSYQRFVAAFKNAGLEIQPFYALKSNPYESLLKTIVACGGSLDVSSPRELSLAVKAKAKKIVYTGPGKTEDALSEILKIKGAEVTLHLESLTELARLGKLTKGRKVPVRCGVRVVPSSHESWSKFGIPLTALKSFLVEAEKHKGLDVCGLQFHISYVKDSKPFRQALGEISEYGRKYLNKNQREKLEFIDIGGGFYPEVFEAEYPWNKEGLLFYDEPDLLQRIMADSFQPRGKQISVQPIEEIARDISRIVARKVKKVFPNVALYAEPGRFFSAASMHYLFSVVDKKSSDSCIVNAGWNSVGWERYQYLHYVPIYNLTRFDPSIEKPFLVYGNLCLPDDIWGYYVHGKKVEIGDLLCMPFQGAYTYTYVQNFIRGIPPVIDLKGI